MERLKVVMKEKSKKMKEKCIICISRAAAKFGTNIPSRQYRLESDKQNVRTEGDKNVVT